MSQFIEKLSAVESQIAALRQKLEPLSVRAENLSQTAAGVAEQVKNFHEESSALLADVAAAQGIFTSILTAFGEVKSEGGQISARAEENQRICDSMTTMFGETFQVVSRFLDTAKNLGIVKADKAKDILEPIKHSCTVPPLPLAATDKHSSLHPDTGAAMERGEAEPAAVEPLITEFKPSELPNLPETMESSASDECEQVDEAVTEEPIAEVPVVEEPEEPVDAVESVEPPTENEEMASPSLNESEDDPLADFLDDLPEEPAAADPTSSLSELMAEPLPSLPDVAAPISSLPTVEDQPEEEVKPLDDIVSQLALPPLQLDTPSEKESGVSLSEAEEQEIEDLLSDLSKPITT